MSFNKTQIEDLVERVLKEVDLYSESAVNLILGTIAQESRFGTYLKQVGSGIAKGVIQEDAPGTMKFHFGPQSQNVFGKVPSCL